jgi:hypothetical protein
LIFWELRQQGDSFAHSLVKRMKKVNKFCFWILELTLQWLKLWLQMWHWEWLIEQSKFTVIISSILYFLNVGFWRKNFSLV